MTGLRDLTLAHFRSYRRASLAFDGRPVALSGLNGAGKTNLIEAISLLSPGRGLRRAGADDMLRRDGAPGWRITALLDTEAGPREVETGAAAGEPRSVRIDGKPAAQNALADVMAVLWLVPAMDRIWADGAEGRRRFLDRAAMSLVPAHADATLDYERAMRERNRLLKDMVRDPHWYAAIETQMARAAVAITANRRETLALLAAAQDRTDGAFPAADLALVHAETELPADEEGLRTLLTQFRPRDLAAGRTLAGPHRADLTAIWRAKGMPASECSTGEQKALLISLVLANARALAGRATGMPVLLLDEVAAHLDAGRRAALYDEICGLGTQAFMTGTGPELFTDLGARAQYLDVTEAGGETVVAERRIP